MHGRNRRNKNLVLLLAAVLSSPWWMSWMAARAVMAQYMPQISFDAAAWRSCDWLAPNLTPRQQMVRDVVENVLPGKSRQEIERLLGPPPTHLEMRRYTQRDLQHHQKDAIGEWEPFPRTGEGWYYEQYDWDMYYGLGLERVFLFDRNWQYGSVDSEALLIRLDEQGRFQSWYIDGSTVWPKMVSREASQRFRPHRAQ